MLNAVKHLYRFVALKESIRQRIRNSTAFMLNCVQHERRLSLISGFRYLVLLLCLLLVSASQAQTCPIETLEGINTTIRIRNRTTSTPFTISCSTDKLILHNYWADGEIKILNKKFLEVRYYVRGGSDLGIGNTLLLCISHGKLQQALHIESYLSNLNHSSDLYYKRTTQRILDTRLTLDAADNMYAITYDTLVLGENQNFQRNNLASRKNIVRFNLTKKIFCNYQRKVNANLINFSGNHDTKKYFSGMAPAFQLNGTEYIFVSGKWYTKSSSKGEYLLVY